MSERKTVAVAVVALVLTVTALVWIVGRSPRGNAPGTVGRTGRGPVTATGSPGQGARPPAPVPPGAGGPGGGKGKEVALPPGSAESAALDLRVAQLATTLIGAAGEPIRVSQSKDGYAQFLGAPPSTRLSVRTPKGATAEAQARDFLAQWDDLFHAKSESAGYRTVRVDGGEKRSFVRLQQTYGGVPVYGAQVVVQVEADGGIGAVVSDVMHAFVALENGALTVKPTVNEEAAKKAAIALVAAAHPKVALTASAPALSIYEPSVLGESGPTRLVWETTVGGPAGAAVEELVLVDANTSEIALHFTMVESAMNRQIYDANNVLGTDPGTLVRTEGQSPTGIADADRAYDYYGDTYNFYSTQNGRDSIDNAGLTMSATVRYDDGRGPNAYWYGSRRRMYFTAGLVADDVTGHELTHGVTDFMSGLLYINESGAMNESLSDMWGEWIDQTNSRGNDAANVRWMMGEDTSLGILRNMQNPPAFGHPDRRGSPYWYTRPDDSELSISREVHRNSGVGNKLCYLLTDGDTFNGRTVTGMGIPVATDLFYECQRLLTSSADYGVLADTLGQAAINLGLTAAQRASVDTGCLAVEIHPSYARITSTARPTNVYYRWRDITPDGTAVGALVDDGKYPNDATGFPIGFPFVLYGATFSNFWIGNNGGILLRSADSLSYSNGVIPSSAAPNGILCPLWDDLFTTGEIRHLSFGTAPNRMLIVQWTGINHISSPSTGTATFQAILFENGDVKFQYQDTTFGNAGLDGGASATIGIESVDGLQGRSQSLASDGLAIVFTPNANYDEPEPARVATGGLPDAVIGEAYSQGLAAADGTAPYQWRRTTGSLPAGLALSAAGVISGTPTGPAGASSFTVEVTDSTIPVHTVGTATLSLAVTAAGSPGAPSNVTAAPNPNSGTFTVSWTAPGTPVADYVPERSSDGGTSWTPLAAQTGTSLAQAGLAQGSYLYRVRARDAVGTFSAYATMPSAVVVDTTAPTVTVSPDGTTTSTASITFAIVFSEAVTGLITTGIAVTNAAAGQLTAVSGRQYTLDVTPTAQGAVTCQVVQSAARDGAGNGSAASNTATVTWSTDGGPGPGAFTVSGRVTSAGAGLVDVVMTGLPNTPRTDAAGNYTASVPSGWGGTVRPVLPGYVLAPLFRTYAGVSTSQAAQDYTATRAVSETVVGFGRGGGGWIHAVADQPGNFAHVSWKQFPWLVYDAAAGESRVACGDVDGDGLDELAVGIGRYPASGGWVAILDDLPHRMALLKWLRIGSAAYQSQNGETWPALGDIDKDGKAEVLVGMGAIPASAPDAAWRSGPDLPQGRSLMGVAAWNGRVYLAGGTPATSDVLVTTIGDDGTPGPFLSTTSMRTARSAHGMAVWNGYLYVAGGTTNWPWPSGGCDIASVESARIQADGTVGPWADGPPLPATRSAFGMLAYGGFLYVVGGLDTPTSLTDSVLFSRINDDGTLAGWTSTTRLPAAWGGMGLAAQGNSLYVVCGSTGGSATNRVLRATILADGSLGAWSDTSPLTGAAREYNAAFAMKGRVYVIGGENAGQPIREASSAPVQADGSLGAWAAEPPLLAARWSPAATAWNGCLYAFGGYGGGDLRSTEWRKVSHALGGYVCIFEDAEAAYAPKLRIRIPESAYLDASGETRPTTGNLSGTADTGGREIIVSGGRGSQCVCHIFGDSAMGHRLQSSYQGGWPAYRAANGEVWLACGNVVGGSEDEIVEGYGGGGGGWMYVSSSTAGSNRWLRLPSPAYNSAVGETRPSLGDVDGDGLAEIAVGMGRYPVDGGWVWYLDDGRAGYASWGRKPVGWTVYNTANGETRPAIGNAR